ncbi:MAG: alginate O-acetyltransferase [Pseudomonas sp.]|uniref:alginate O-acetyltransferase n=1 Tax=Pseudomonas sp. TaxID=306 RepID=UPI002727853D|nr:alginate O-acetyltransferase [Pseudomonas sp.]MDO9617043.1 alginate O-acetyltransferase [Pseudomonas sp.]MDP2447727.1 alginate O-acetyltransferase [Pseudomonas sp.]MDZ4336218.1 alginate O-acetyltransferase [Pseudomonas sp.]
MTRPLRTLYIALFISVLGLLFAWSIRGVLSYQLPKQFSIIDGGLAKTFESHYDEHFPLKTLGTSLWAGLDYLLFNEGRPGVQIGEQGWLYSSEEFKPEVDGAQQVRENLALIKGVRDELAQHDVMLLLAIVPSKSRLYPEFVGDNPTSSLRQGLYQRFLNELRDAEIAAPDLLSTLQAGKASGAMFLRTDTHWTPAGADLVAQQLSSTLKSAISLAGEPQVFVTQASPAKPYKGDLTRFLPLEPLFGHLLPPPDQLRRNATQAAKQAAGADALFSDSEMPVALVGTSYSANPAWNFAGALRQHLQRDLSNHAEDGQGPLVPMLKYLQSDELQDAPPQLVIWEFPERYLPMSNDLSAFDAQWLSALKHPSGNRRLAASDRH